MIKGVIFDLDGTLLNSMPVWENLGELYLKSLGIEAEPDLGRELFTMSMGQAADYIIGHYGLKIDRERVMEGIVREVQDFYAEKVPLKAGARDFLEEFRERQLPMVIVTSGERQLAEDALKRLGIYNWFDGIYTCTEFGTDKNHPDIYNAVSLMMDADPKDILVFEDAYHAVKTAKDAGFVTAAVYDQSNDRDLKKIWESADYYLPEFKDFDVFWRRVSEK